VPDVAVMEVVRKVGRQIGCQPGNKEPGDLRPVGGGNDRAAACRGQVRLVGCLARPAIEAVAGKHMLLVAEIVVDAGYREVGSLRDSNAADEPLDVDSVALAAADLGD